MICEIIRGLVIVSRVAEATQEIADKAGFACDRPLAHVRLSP